MYNKKNNINNRNCCQTDTHCRFASTSQFLNSDNFITIIFI